MTNVAAITMTTGDDKAKNVDTAFAAVREAKKRGAEWVQLPEMWPFMGSYDHIYDMAEAQDGPLFQTMAALAKELNIVLFAGTVGERPDAGLSRETLLNERGQRRVYNTSYVFGRDGKILAKYRKTHLFNLLRDDGPSYKESDGFIAGDGVTTVEIDGLVVALSICYDLRFPELYARLGRDSAYDVVTVPSAFTKATGLAHWELLLRARAIERQCYVFAANQTGTHAPGKESFGHSMVVDPWGTLLATTGAATGIAFASLEKAKVLEARAKLPALANRRPTLY